MQYEMTEEQHRLILDASQPVMCIMIGGKFPKGPQENANQAWQQLSTELDFNYMTVKAIEGESDYFFEAESCTQ